MPKPIQVTVDRNAPPPTRAPMPESLEELIQAGANTATLLAEHGPIPRPTEDDLREAQAVMESYAADPEKTAAAMTPTTVGKMTPASIIMINNILQEFGRAVVQDAQHVRHLVTNKLLLETENADPRVRLKALELLGKISDVGLFSEKVEVSARSSSTEDLRAAVRARLLRLASSSSVSAGPPEDAVVLDGEVLDLGAELGLAPVDPLREPKNG